MGDSLKEDLAQCKDSGIDCYSQQGGQGTAGEKNGRRRCGEKLKWKLF
jgi:hypothetical protein